MLFRSQDENILINRLEKPLLKMQSQANLEDLRDIIDIIAPYKEEIGQYLLLDSKAIWNVMIRIYRKTMPKTSFIDYFWSWRVLFGGLFSILLAPMPDAKVYHALCTGYAGLYLARARLETGRPCIITEHGIYTNERRIEIASADYLYDRSLFNLSSSKNELERDIKDLWVDTFKNYSTLCYQACSKIITLYKGNQEFQLMDGADKDKLLIIPNGIDYKKYSSIPRGNAKKSVALIGRVVSIKDIKTYIKAIDILKESLPEIEAFIIGPDNEEPEYAKECREIVEHLNLQKNVIFTGKVRIEPYLQVIGVMVLTSISEAQPLVILEAGAAGIPIVATDVGACREMITGDSNEDDGIGPGGVIVPLTAPKATADALLQLLTQDDYYKRCSRSISTRVSRYYNKENQYKSYAFLYGDLIEESEGIKDIKQLFQEII